ncbi:MAG: hypothetical protein QG629_401 [Patescibacteria group bacterium]|nr:hypothetical protein [Patescibacteria group bacterium]
MHNFGIQKQKEMLLMCGYRVHTFVYNLCATLNNMHSPLGARLHSVVMWPNYTHVIRAAYHPFCTQNLPIFTLFLVDLSTQSTGPIISIPNVKEEVLYKRNGVLRCN